MESQSEMKVFFRALQISQVSWAPNTPHEAGGPGLRVGAGQTDRPQPSSLPSCALQREGFHLQRVHCLLPGFLPDPCFVCGQRDRLCGWLLLPQWFAVGGGASRGLAVSSWPGMDEWESGAQRMSVCGMNEGTTNQ